MKHSIEKEADAVASAPGSVWTKKQVIKLWSSLSHRDRGVLARRLEALAKATEKAERIRHATTTKTIQAALLHYPKPVERVPTIAPRRRGSSRKWPSKDKSIQE